MARSDRNLSLFPGPVGDSRFNRQTTARSSQSRSSPVQSSEAVTKAATSRLWLAVCLYDLVFEASAIADNGRKIPAVVVDTDDVTIAAASPAAQQLGIAPGCALNAALAMADNLRIEARDIDCEQRVLHSLAIWARTLTPTVSIVEPNVLLLEIRGSLRLFGGAEKITSALNAQLLRRGLTARSSLAPGAQAAVWLSRYAGGDVRDEAGLPAALRSVPVKVTGWPQKLLARLAEMGIRRIGDLLRLPRDGLALRIGKKYLQELDQALCRAFEHYAVVPLPEQRSFSIDLPAETSDRAMLCEGCELLFGRLMAELRRQQKQIARFTVQFFHLHREASSETFELLMPTLEQSHLLDLLTRRLERVELPAPVIALELQTGELLDLCADTPELLTAAESSSSAQQAQAVSMIERLQERCGPKSVFAVSLASDHRPELAWSADQSVKKAERAGPECHAGPGAQLSPWAGERPLWLLPEPQPCSPSDWQIELGPERIESGWWDERCVNRDYYIAKSKSRERLWVYFDHRQRSWYVHGVFG